MRRSSGPGLTRSARKRRWTQHAIPRGRRTQELACPGIAAPWTQQVRSRRWSRPRPRPPKTAPTPVVASCAPLPPHARRGAKSRLHRGPRAPAPTTPRARPRRRLSCPRRRLTCPRRTLSVPEVARLARTRSRGERRFQAFFDTDRASNGGREAINALTGLQRRIARGSATATTTGYGCFSSAASTGPSLRPHRRNQGPTTAELLEGGSVPGTRQPCASAAPHPGCRPRCRQYESHLAACGTAL